MSGAPRTGAVDDALRTVLRMLEVDRRRVAGAVLAGVGALGSAVALAAVSAWLIARASQMPPVMYLMPAAAAVRMFGVSRGVLRYVERLASHDVALRGMATLRSRLYERLAGGTGHALTELRRGDLLARVGADVDAVGDLVVRGLVPVAVAVVVGGGAVVGLSLLLPAAGLCLLAALLLAGVLAPALGLRAARRAEEEGAAARAAAVAATLTLLDGADELRVAGRVQDATRTLGAAETAAAAAVEDASRPAAWAAALQPLATAVAVLGSVVLGAIAMAEGDLDPVALAVVVLTPLAVAEVVATAPAAAVQLHRSRAAARRLVALLDEGTFPARQLTGPQPMGSQLTDVGSTGPGTTDEVLVTRNLSWGRPGRPVLGTGLGLTLREGRSVAVVGPSGCGKTTLLLTLAGELRPVAGSVHACGGRGDGTALVLEDAHVFDTTLLENLRVARGDVQPREAWDALDAVGLGTWARALPDGLATRVGSDAGALSGGERRRLLLARALLSPARVLLLDEPTEHVDTDDRALLTGLLTTRLTGGRAVVVVTHRREGLESADEVIDLGRGGSVDPRRVCPVSSTPRRTT